jgi:hypothetical protein
VATIILLTTKSTGTVSPILFLCPLTYFMIPSPTNMNMAAAAAILSSHPGKGSA